MTDHAWVVPGALSSAGRERLPYKQEVSGSNPLAPIPASASWLHTLQAFKRPVLSGAEVESLIGHQANSFREVRRCGEQVPLDESRASRGLQPQHQRRKITSACDHRWALAGGPGLARVHDRVVVNLADAELVCARAPRGPCGPLAGMTGVFRLLISVRGKKFLTSRH